MTKVEQMIKEWNDGIITEKQARQVLDDILRKKTKNRLVFRNMQMDRAYVDPDTGGIAIPPQGSSGGPQPAHFTKENALKLADWIREVYEDDGRNETSGL